MIYLFGTEDQVSVITHERYIFREIAEESEVLE